MLQGMRSTDNGCFRRKVFRRNLTFFARGVIWLRNRDWSLCILLPRLEMLRPTRHM